MVAKAVGIDEVTKEEYGRNLDANVTDLVERLKRKAYKPQPAMRVYIPKDNGKMRPLAIACYEDKFHPGFCKVIVRVAIVFIERLPCF